MARPKIPSKAPPTAVADAGGESALVDQFSRDLGAVLRQVRDAHGGNEGFNADGDVRAERRPVAHFGVIGRRLLTITRQLQRKDEVGIHAKHALLLAFGDKFAATNEFVAAERFFYSQVSRYYDLEADQPKDLAYVLAMYGAAMCQFHVAQRADPFVRFPGSLAKMLDALGRLQRAMESASQLVRKDARSHSWLLLNGSISVYNIGRPLQVLGFEREMVPYFKWCILCLESTVVLSTSKYILWRLQLHAAVCECFEATAKKRPKKSSRYFRSALSCAEHAVQVVARLRKEEELDPPLPKSVAATLKKAETLVGMLVARYRSLSKPEFFGRKAIEGVASVQSPCDRFRLAMDSLEKAFDRPTDDSSVTELLLFAVELAVQLSRPLDVAPDLGDPIEAILQDIDSQVPLPCHLILIHELHRRGQTEGMQALIESARVRISRGKDSDTLTQELDLYETLLRLDQAAPEEDTAEANPSNKRQRYVDVASALAAFSCLNPHWISIPIRAVLIHAALRLWKETTVHLIQALDTTPRPEDATLDAQSVYDGTHFLQTIYDVLRAVDFDDLVFLGEVCVRLCTLLTVQQNRRVAVRLVRDMLGLIDSFRDRVVLSSTHVGVESSEESLSRVSCSFDASSQHTKSDCSRDGYSSSCSSREFVGVEGTGSQLGSLYQELCCMQVDMYLLLFKLELDEAAVVDEIHSDFAARDHPRLHSLQNTSTLTKIEGALRTEFKKNAYALVLLNVQRLCRATDPSHQESLLGECFRLLHQVEVQERELVKNLTAQAAHLSLAETLVPRPPKILSRTSTCVTIEIVPFKPSLAAARRRIIDYYMAFAKPSGAGTDVSLNNCEFPGTGEQIHHSARRITISGLSPNTSYVFAVAAFDVHGEVIQGIGETSRTVCTVNPLSLVSCYGYVAQASHEAGLRTSARDAAMQVYDAAVSKEFSLRPGWAANYFYRHALKRDVIARWPIPLLNHVVQSVQVICQDEDGDPSRDGQLVSYGLSIKANQVKVLEASKMIAIGLEAACAAADYEQIRALTFKGYRVLLPLLHLDDVNAMTFAGLTVYYQALWCIPPEHWDTDTRSIAARIAFELLRIAPQQRHLRDAIFRQVAKLKICVSWNGAHASTELAAMNDWIALTESSLGSVLSESTPEIRPTTAATTPSTAQPSSGGKMTAAPHPPKASPAAASLVPTPPTSARDVENTPLPRLSELIFQSKLVLRDVFKVLERFMKTDRDCLAAFCKLCHSLIDAGDDVVVEEWIGVLKLTGSIGTECKGVLKSAGLAHLLPDPAIVSVAAPSAPSTARSTTNTPRKQDASGDTTTPVVPVPEPEYGVDDEYMYTWCGEICLIKATILHHKIAQLQTHDDEVDCFHGPRCNCAFTIFSCEEKERLGQNQTDQDLDGSNNEANDRQEPCTSPSEDTTDSRLELFSRFMERVSASCRLFGFARAWHGLQTAAQLVMNSIWHIWLSPDIFGRPANSRILDAITTCVNSMLTMIESVMTAIKEEQAGRVTTTVFDRSSDQPRVSSHNGSLSLASTSVIVSAMASLTSDRTWISNLVEYTIRALFAAKRWNQLVQIGKKYHLLSGGNSRFSEKTLPLVVHAQREYLAEQTALVSNMQRELAVFTKSFRDAEAKRKKKKSRLVVEEIMTPEELEFRSKRDDIERTISMLTREKSQRQRELEELEKMHEIVSRATNKCVEGLDYCRSLLEKYHRFGETAVSHQQVKAAFSHSVTLSRQNRQRFLVGRALQEVGDFLWKCSDLEGAVKAWNEAIDNAFNALRATACWRDVLEHDQGSGPGSVDTLVEEGDGLWVSLDACVALMKLILVDSTLATPTIELARMAAATVSRIVTKSSLPHPSLLFLFGSHQIFQLWPGRDLLVDSERLNPTLLVSTFSVTIQVLLQYQQPVEAMPVIALYESLALHCFRDCDHVVNARRYRLESLIQCGRFHDAFEVLALLLPGADAKLPATYSNSDALKFRDDLRPSDSLNKPALGWLASIDIQKTYDKLMLLPCKPETARQVLLSVVKLAVELSEREGIEDLTSPLRQIGNNIAAATSTFLAQALQQTKLFPLPRSTDDTNVELSSRAPDTSPVWNTLTLHNAEAELLLQQARLAACGGQWTLSLELCQRSIGVSKDLSEALHKVASTFCPLSVGHRVPPEMLLKPSILIARARIMSVKSHLSLGGNSRAIEHVDLAVDEASVHFSLGHFVRHLGLLRVQALLQSGLRESASRELVKLHESFVLNHSRESLEFVQLLRLRAYMDRISVMEGQVDSGTIDQIQVLEEAEGELDRLLQREGWIGADAPFGSNTHHSLYHTLIPTFVYLKAEIVEALMGFTDKKSVGCETRATRALLAIDVGLKAVDHSVKSLAPVKAKLLVQRGSVLKKMLILGTNLSHGNREDVFQQCVESLVAGIAESIRANHDRELVRRAFIELTDLYGSKLVSGKEAEHLQAAFHYLNCSLMIQSFENTLYNSLELQNGSITNIDKLPAFVVSAILQQSVPDNAQDPRTSTAQPVNAGRGAAGEAVKREAINSQRLINYFINALRAQYSLPAGTSLYDDIVVVTHDYLVRNHSSYTKLCCLEALPVVPTEDPEIKGGLICTQWMADTTPGIGGHEHCDSSLGMRTLLFTLGTARVESYPELVESNAVIKQWNEVFATLPLFSKRVGLLKDDILGIWKDLSRLRVDMEDESSLTLDISGFSSRFQAIMLKVQGFFRTAQSSSRLQVSSGSLEGHGGIDSTGCSTRPTAPCPADSIMDSFGVEIPVVCSLAAVKLLENLFHIDVGVNNAVDNVLCYFLRDLLDS